MPSFNDTSPTCGAVSGCFNWPLESNTHSSRLARRDSWSGTIFQSWLIGLMKYRARPAQFRLHAFVVVLVGGHDDAFRRERVAELVDHHQGLVRRDVDAAEAPMPDLLQGMIPTKTARAAVMSLRGFALIEVHGSSR